LSLEQAMVLARMRAPNAVMARHAVREAEARRVAAGLIFPANPRLSFDVRPPMTFAGTNHDIGYGGMLDLPVDIGGAPSARVREADRWADLARAELAVDELQVRFETWTAYVRASIGDVRLTALGQSLDIGERVLAAARKRAELGASGDIDYALAESEVTQLRVAIQDVARERDRRVMDLRHWVGLPAGEPVTLTTALVDPGRVPAANILVMRALSSRPELATIRRRIDVLDASDTRLAREVFPRTGLYLGIDAAPASPLFGVIGLSVELPFAQRNQGQRARVVAARTGEDERLQLEARRIEREVVAAHASFESRLVQLQMLTDSALPAAQKALDLTEIGFRSGRFDVFRVTAAAREVAKLRAMRLDALEAGWLDRIELDRAVGGLP
jgi:cobalt-zinc-cadmium efflux system outer membrane protein